MVEEEKPSKLKEIITHIIAMSFIFPLVFLLVWSAFDKSITIPPFLLFIGSSAVGFYLSKYTKF
jgi:uncharacterized membrane protein